MRRSTRSGGRSRTSRETWNAYGNLAVVYFLRATCALSIALMEQMVRANPGVPTLRFAAHTLEQFGDGAGAAGYRRRAEAAEQRQRPS